MSALRKEVVRKVKPEDCPKLDECNKVKMILGKDLLDFPLRLFGQSVLIVQRSKRVVAMNLTKVKL